MKKALFRKIGLIVGCAALLVLVNVMFLRQYIQEAVNPMTAYVAVHDIEPRHQITEEDLQEIEVPGIYVQESAYRTKEEIVGKYTDIQGKIPAGSLFYRSMLYDAEELPDYANLQLKNGQVLYSLEMMGNDGLDCVEGQRMDVYVTIEDETIITDCILRHTRIVSLKDHKGLRVSDPDSTGVPYLITLAINQEDIEMVSLAEKIGKIRLFTSNDAYDTEAESIREPQSQTTMYLLQCISDSKMMNSE